MVMNGIKAGDRAKGALLGLAIGDALGMPTQSFSREVIQKRYGLLDDFYPGPEDNDISHGTPAGRVTDDTDQAMIVGQLYLQGNGKLDPLQLANALIAWKDEMEASGSLDLLGPSTLKALNLVQQGVPADEAGRWGDTDGAAMRITPIGIATPVDSLTALVDEVEAVCQVTHNTGIAISGASAVAAAVSSGIAGNSMNESLELAVEAARIGARRGHYAAGADVAARILRALSQVCILDVSTALDDIYELIGVGVSTQEAVPAALTIAALLPDDLWETCRHAASLGGDCDTIAAMAGAVVGAHVGASTIPDHIYEKLAKANPKLDLSSLADGLLGLRLTRQSVFSYC